MSSDHHTGRYLLLDEPTTSLDLAHRHAALKTAREAAGRGIGVVAILHDLSLAAMYADRVVALRGGRIVPGAYRGWRRQRRWSTTPSIRP